MDIATHPRIRLQLEPALDPAGRVEVRYETMDTPNPKPNSPDWIDELTDSQCMEIFWLYVDPPEPFLAQHPPALLGKAMRYALRQIPMEGQPG